MQDLRHLELGAGLSTITRNRVPHATTGVCHGGVAVIYKRKIGCFKKIDVQNPDSYEILPVIGSVTCSSRKFVVIAVYIPPNYTVARGSACLDYLENLVFEIKRRYSDPFIYIAGDFNQWAIDTALQEFPDISEVMLVRREATVALIGFFVTLDVRSPPQAHSLPSRLTPPRAITELFT